MQSYSVIQVAEMLGTNPETIRRWIRDGKLAAIQPSAKKDGLKITGEALSSFVSQTPKFLPQYQASVASAATAVAGIAVGILGGVVASVLLECLSKKKEPDYRISLDDIKKFLQISIADLEDKNKEKRYLIMRSELEISQNSMKIEQFQYLLDNEEVLSREIEKLRQ